ncbi:MAG: 50S ribosomal protein L24 [Clostridiales bacterium]|nr:50S ribosomal protein L24 [Clostridiales bacterium]
MSLNVKKGDTVLIIAGKDKGKTGKVVSCDPANGRVVVEDCNMITKHTKPRGANQPGGRNKVAGPIDVSNVQIVCPDCHKATRVAHKIDGENKIRVCNKCGASLEAKKVEKKAKKSKADKAEKTEEAVAEEKAKKPAKKTAKKTAKKEETAPVAAEGETAPTENGEN